MGSESLSGYGEAIFFRATLNGRSSHSFTARTGLKSLLAVQGQTFKGINVFCPLQLVIIFYSAMHQYAIHTEPHDLKEKKKQ